MDVQSSLPWTLETAIMVLLIGLPFAAFVAGLGLRSRRWNPVMAIGAMSASTLLATYLVFGAKIESPVHTRFNWISFSDATLSLGLYADRMTLALLLMISVISLLVMIYSLAYLKGDALFDRYWTYLSFFCSAMLALVTADSLIGIFICWEWVGLGSWLLIGFWNTKQGPARAATQAFLLNRIGDAAFLAGILLALSLTGTTDISQLLAWSVTAQPETLTILSLLLMGGSLAKSAQFPLQIWLPNAMEGPTPVSSLIHAATMVAAGVYLLIRTFPLFTHQSLMVLGTLGGVTALMAGLAALVQWDIKRLLAYSTVSQLGLMFLVLATGRPDAALFHLITHAVMKCLLFLAAGSVIHQFHHALPSFSEPDNLFSGTRDPQLPLHQDMRLMGGLRKSMPWTFVVYLMAAASMAGIPFTAGFLSKETMLGGLFANEAQPPAIRLLWLILGLTSFALTTAYLGRQAYLVFWGENRFSKSMGNLSLGPATDAPGQMRLPMALLAAGTLFFGFSLLPFEAEKSWALHLMNLHAPETPSWMIFVSLTLIGAGAAVCYVMVRGEVSARFSRQGWGQRVLLNHFFQEKIMYRVFATPLLQFSRWLKVLDEKVVDGAFTVGAHLLVTSRPGWPQLSNIANSIENHLFDGAVRSIYLGIGRLGKVVRKVQTGRVQWYLWLSLSLWAILMMWVVIVWKK